MAYERIESQQHEHSESPLHEFLYSVPPPYISRKILHQEKSLPGIYPFTLYPTLRTKFFTTGLTYEDRRTFRKFYKKKVTEYYGQDTSYGVVDFSVTDTLEGVGNAPQTTGYPNGWNADWTPSETLIQLYNSILAGPPAGQSRVFISRTDDVSNFEGFPEGGHVPPDPAYPLITETRTLSDEPEFAPILNTCVSRLLARSFDGLVFSDAATGTWWDFERFSEYWGTHIEAPETNPASFTGNPQAESILNVYHPGLVPTALRTTCAPFEDAGYNALASFWVWPEWERINFDLPWLANRVIAERVMFKVNNAPSTDYWIARGVLKYTTAGIGLHPVVHVFRSGTLALNEECEVNFPFYSGGEGWRDFVRLGENDISCGAVCFAILNETPAHWSNRTGISVTPTADSTIFSSDSDITTDTEP